MSSICRILSFTALRDGMCIYHYHQDSNRNGLNESADESMRDQAYNETHLVSIPAFMDNRIIRPYME